MPAESQDSSARTPNVAEQKLKDRGSADDLRSLRLLRPTQRIADRTGLLWTRCRAKRLRNFQEPLLGNSAKVFDQFRRVARKVFLQDLVRSGDG